MVAATTGATGAESDPSPTATVAVDVAATAALAAERGSAFVCLSHSPFMTLPGLDPALGEGYRAAVEVVRSFLTAYAPDVVVLFAPDHMNLLMQVRPPFTAVLSGRTLPEFGVPELPLSVHPSAPAVAAEVVGREVDLAVAEEVALDHGFGLTLTQLFDAPSSAPVIPVVVNAIGFPLFPVARAARVGEAFGAVFAERGERVLFVGTGGMSHNPPFPEPAPGAVRLDSDQRRESLSTAVGYIDPEWDQALLTGMAIGRADTLTAVDQAAIDRRGGGANEIRTWAAAWAAAGHAPAAFTSYQPVPEWITGMGVALGAGAPRGGGHDVR